MSADGRDPGGLIRRGTMARDVLGAHYTTVFNQAVRDRRLSRRARGLLVELLSHCAGFGVSLATLLRNGPEGRDALTAALRELEEHGYLHRVRERDPQGRLKETRYDLTDMPDGIEITAKAPWTPPQQGAGTPPENAAATGARSGTSRPTPEQESLDEYPQTRRSQPKSDLPAQAEPTQVNPTPKKNKYFKKTNQQNTNPLPPSPPGTHERTNNTHDTHGTDRATAARGARVLLSIARHHPELHAALATGTTLADQAPLAGRLLEGGVSREHLREALIGRPYPPPGQRTHSLAALVAARLRHLARLAATADRSRTEREAPAPADDADSIEHAYTPEAGPIAPRPECPGQDGLCGRPVGAPGELCPQCRTTTPKPSAGRS
ncbi:hypothetical protein [Streptomyces longispororuber]|uniref:hypothetical protein n=1 Tax=Streptomyces longispororuber TaxID=68230 RepID=UPI00210E8FB4|nr:hypothetical protein [Streptomyces longispororuber]MCQ4210422.1 hypothetical protein [Streptomyces longispororuber]